MILFIFPASSPSSELEAWWGTVALLLVKSSSGSFGVAFLFTRHTTKILHGRRCLKIFQSEKYQCYFLFKRKKMQKTALLTNPIRNIRCYIKQGLFRKEE